ncbi:NmrA family NAD(P)-binding protein [Shinella sp.]|uniref:NmrA family NAD(P)-binding protein n=1 Tax=Shinella sp. TaxID=1870904 RepID=UPI0028A61B01|nr:NmrA family NAD(P)-binding protein [Shinella sp.]
MFIVLGATGHIGSELVNLLDAAGETVIAIVHDAGKADDIRTANVEPIALDVGKTAPLHDLFRRGRRAFLLNPPADPGGDTDATETATARAITDALPGSGLEKVVVASTYGAQPGEGIGDLSVLFDFEQQAEASGVPTAINRAAYYYTNLDMLLEPAREGVLQTPFPGDMRLPMVSPVDIAKAAASRLLSKSDDVGIRYVEGPRRYTFDDVATAFSTALGRPVRLETIPRDKWEESFRALGFSPEAARAYARMTAATVDGPHLQADPVRGDVALLDHIRSLSGQ